MSGDKVEINGGVSRSQKINAIINVAKFNPLFAALIVIFGLAAALLEGMGIGFILPVVELIQAENPSSQADGIMGVFLSIYQTLGIPFTLGYVVIGGLVVISARYLLSFLVAWFREALRTYYIRDLQIRAFDNALYAKVDYFDQEGTDDILNAIITQTYYAGRVIIRVAKFLEQSFISIIYVSVALLIAPILTIISMIMLGGMTYMIRSVVDPGYELGDAVADANERRQETAQAGTKGIRDIRIFGVTDEILDDFIEAVNKYTRARISLRRNEAAIRNFYNWMVAVSVFVLIFISITFVNLSIGELSVFLFAMFRLGPRVGNLNQTFYGIENDLPHLVRTQKFTDDLKTRQEPNKSTESAPNQVDKIEFDDVWFSYTEENVLRGISFVVEKGEFIAFVGQSGAGKSTIVSLVAQFYKYDEGDIRANDIPIDKFDVAEWREHLSIVRQNPYIFNDTLEYNVTIGNRDAPQSKIEKVCKIAKVDEFIGELPKGYDTELGDEGVRLSGGQKQRVALARALLEDTDVLILDEATSDLDTNLEKKVQEAIEELESDYSIITIAHRLSTIENADRIYTIENGRIVECGSHTDLIDNGGSYANLYKMQSRG